MRTLLRQLLTTAVRLGAIGLLAVGLSGGVAFLFGTVGTTSFVSGDAPNVRYTAARCAEYREYEPHAHTCEQAATEHHFGEVVEYRVAAGVFGAAALAAIAFVRRRRPVWFSSDRLPVAFDDTVGALVFGGAALWLLALGIDQATLGNNGAGFFLSGGLVSLPAAAWFAERFGRRVLSGAAPGA